MARRVAVIIHPPVGHAWSVTRIDAPSTDIIRARRSSLIFTRR